MKNIENELRGMRMKLLEKRKKMFLKKNIQKKEKS